MTKKELLSSEFPELVDNRHEIMAKKTDDGIAVVYYVMHEAVIRTWLGKEKFLNLLLVEGNERIEKPSVTKKDIQQIFWNQSFFKTSTSDRSFVISSESEGIIHDFMEEQGMSSYDAADSVIMYEKKIKNKESEKRLKKKLASDTQRVTLRTSIPKDFDNWLEKKEVVFALSRKKKSDEVTCSYCGHTWHTDKRKNEHGSCPHCKAQGIFLVDNIRTKKYVDYSGAYIGKNQNGELVECIRRCVATYDGSYTKRSVRIYEGDRRIIPVNGSEIFVPYQGGYKSSHATFNRRGSMYYMYSETPHLYPGNIKRIFSGSVYEKFEPEKFAKYCDKDAIPCSMSGYLISCRNHPIIEQIMKGGYRQFIYDLITKNASSIVADYVKEYLKREMPKNTSLAKEMGLTKNQFRQLKESENQLYEIPIAAYANKTVNEVPLEVVRTYAELNKENKYTPIGRIINTKEMLTIPFINYLNKVPDGNKNTFLKDYLDYIRWMEVMGYALTKSRLRPKDFQKEHDRMEALHNDFLEAKRKKSLEMEDEYMKEIAPLVEKLFHIPLSSDDFEIVVPTCRADLIKESEKLHHCVRGYSKQIFQHECVIVFIRKKSELNEPFYTMEITPSFQIGQCRTLKNDSYVLDEKMKEVVESYSEAIKKRSKEKKMLHLIEKLHFQCAA